ncbi:MAG: gamma-glutamyl-gamma-aminobutyrate hydrolase family protein, partial [Gammaproteobacteria bacterium]|nr:gamma-glutamyl-gamma-aminobutyrate hydrolase family protein [Gammaproteobacteria bacterium]
MTDLHTDRVLILDFGSQYTQLIARRVRELNVYSEIYPYDMDDDAIRDFKPTAIILSGGPESVTELNGVRVPDSVFELAVPVLGICYGMQCMAAQLGGKVTASPLREFGHARVRARGHSTLL